MKTRGPTRRWDFNYDFLNNLCCFVKTCKYYDKKSKYCNSEYESQRCGKYKHSNKIEEQSKRKIKS